MTVITQQRSGQEAMVTLAAHPIGESRTETLMGREFRVVPSVMVQGQVLHNNLGVCLLPPDEITPAWADNWNMIPVIVGDHPTVRGVPVSGRSPGVLNSRGGGFIFGAHVDMKDGTSRLKAEVWLDLARATEVPELGTILEMLDEGKPVGLSTGFPVIAEQQQGVFDGEPYELIMYPLGADHLAVFSELTGACSLTHGCGLGLNHEGACPDATAQQEEDVAKNAEGSAVQNQDEAVSEEEGVTAGAEDEQQTEVENQEAADTEETETSQGEVEAQAESDPAVQNWFRRIYNRVVEHFQLFPDRADNESDEERRRALGEALRQTFGGLGREIWVLAVYSDEEYVVFEIESQQGVDLFRSDFTIADNGEVSLSDPVPVRRVTTFEPVQNESGASSNSNQKESAMDRQTMLNQLAETGPLDKEALNKLSDCQLKGLLGADKANGKEAANTGDGEAAATSDEQEDKEPGDQLQSTEGKAQQQQAAQSTSMDELKTLILGLQTKVEEQDATIAELRQVTEPAVQAQQQEREDLIEQLAGNSKVTSVWGKEELENMSLEALHKVHAVSRGESYVGRGGPRVTQNQAESAYAETKPYWVTNDKKEEVNHA